MHVTVCTQHLGINETLLLYTSCSHEVYQVEEAFLIPSHLRRPIDCLQPKVSIIVTKPGLVSMFMSSRRKGVSLLPIIRKGPSEGSSNVNTVLPDSLEDLRHEAQIVYRSRRIEKLICQVGLFSFSEDWETEFCNNNGRPS